MNKQNGILFTVTFHLPATVNHFLRPALHFRITALHRIKIQRFEIRAGIHTGRGSAAQTDQHARPTQLDQQSTGREFFLGGMFCRDLADSTCEHDRLVITAHFSGNIFFIRTEISGQIRTAKLVVECRAANRAFEHNLQR